MRYLLDTNVCIRYLNGQSNKIRQKLSMTNPEEIVLCSVSNFWLENCIKIK
jgi:tRNA(fMet)-specific endonuclease VapC